MTTAERRPWAVVAREVRATPVSTVLGPLAFVGLGVWLMAATPAWWIGLFAVLAGVALLVRGVVGLVVVATGYAGPSWWRQATGRDVDA
ncbi:hypothetical protein [uncultured Pseudokineococcus sp.]|uniref:hypothetical protein n=1 Tax=uncultured Pseudokineococcus sp. TaxID=1642928 RepID=UPI002627E9F4|nr:hypothetical protein [uncultured Pseudokineococcus sp.]